jgi:hypothetical protein
MNFRNKLERLSLESLSKWFQALIVSVVLPTYIRLGWKNLPGTNSLGYYENW